MFSETLFSLIFVTLALLVPLAFANGSGRHDPYNQCGAPFCGSNRAAAAAAALARMDRNSTADNLSAKPIDKLVKL